MESLELQGISKQFAGHQVLSDISFTVEPGQRLAIVGQSGSGKTTLLRLIAGLESPSAGKIKIGNQDVTTRPASKRGVGMVFQDYATYPRLTVSENLTVTLVGNNLKPAEKSARLNEMVQWLHLDGMLKRLPTELSGGQLQRVALGKALMSQPGILLLDEPFSQLDIRLAEQMRRLLNASHQRYGTTQIMVTHQPLDALMSFDKLAVLNSGRLVQFASPSEVRQRPKNLFAAELTSPFGLNVMHAEALVSYTEPRDAIFAFRPESIQRIDTNSILPTGAIELDCQVLGMYELGIVRLCELQYREHVLRMLVHGSSPDLPERIKCFVNRADLFQFPAPPGSSSVA